MRDGRRRLLFVSLQQLGTFDGARASTHSLMSALESRGWRVEILAPAPTDGAGIGSIVRRLVAMVVVLARASVRLVRADILYVRSHPGTLPLLLVARVLRVPAVQELNGVVEDFVLAHPWSASLRGAIDGLWQVVLRRGDAVIAVSPPLASWVERRVGRPCAVVESAADPDRFRPGAATDVQLPERYVAYVGVLQPWQDLHTMLAARDHPDWPDDVELVVAGDGPLRDLVAAGGNGVRYLGSIPPEDVAGVLAGAVAGLSIRTTAGWHSSPLKLFEAMSVGVPVIASDLPGQAAIVREGAAGFVVDVGDAAAVAAAVRDLCADASLRARLGAAGRESIVQRHSWEARARRTELILLDVLGERARGAVER